MNIKRAPHFGAIRNTLIILLIIAIAIFTISATTTKETKISNPVATEQPIQEVEEKIVEEKITNEEKIEKEPKAIKTEPTKVVPQATAQPIATVTPQPVATSSGYIYNVTPEDRETLARLIFLESNTESLDCQKAIVSVIINRMHSGYWGNTVNSVVYARNQFTPASQIPYTTPTSTNYEAVDYVLTNGVTLPSYVLYFRSSYHFSWSGYVPYTAMGNTYFGYMAKDMK